MKSYNITILMVFFLALNSCSDFFNSEIDPPNMSKESQLVVHSYISPYNNHISVSVRLSTPIFAENNEYDNKIVDNAAVYLSDTQGSKVNIPYINYIEKYELSATQFHLKEGETYTLEVSIPDGKNIKSTCTIPPKIESEIRNIQISEKEYHPDYDYIGRNNNGTHTFKQVSFEFKDAKDVENYYGAKYRVVLKRENGESVSKEIVSYYKIFSDANRDGETIYVKSEDHQYFDINSIDTLEISLFSLDKNYYNYHKSVHSQHDNSENPFSEPVIIKSNIENGLGIFGGYSEKKHIIKY